jgi:hypothetical protein
MICRTASEKLSAPGSSCQRSIVLGILRMSFARTLPDSFNRLPKFPGDSEPCGDGLRATRRPACQTTQLHARTVRWVFGGSGGQEGERAGVGVSCPTPWRPAVLDYAARLT